MVRKSTKPKIVVQMTGNNQGDEFSRAFIALMEKYKKEILEGVENERRKSDREFPTS